MIEIMKIVKNKQNRQVLVRQKIFTDKKNPMRTGRSGSKSESVLIRNITCTQRNTPQHQQASSPKV